MVSLPGLKNQIEEISRERNLPSHAVQLALGSVVKRYERYRRAQSLDKRHFDEEYFDNFEVELDVEEAFASFPPKPSSKKSATPTIKFHEKFRKLLPRLSWETLLF